MFSAAISVYATGSPSHDALAFGLGRNDLRVDVLELRITLEACLRHDAVGMGRALPESPESIRHAHRLHSLASEGVL